MSPINLSLLRRKDSDRSKGSEAPSLGNDERSAVERLYAIQDIETGIVNSNSDSNDSRTTTHDDKISAMLLVPVGLVP